MTKEGFLTLAVILLFSLAAMAGETTGPANVLQALNPLGLVPVTTSKDFLDIIDSCNASGVTGDNGLIGVEFDGTDYWVTGSGESNHGGDNRLYRLSRGCQLLDDLSQGTTSGWGWRDLAWDGTYLYASDENELVKFLPPPIGGPINKIYLCGVGAPPQRALAVDPATGHLWTANFRNDIVEFDPATGQIFCRATNSLSVFGMAWDDSCYASLGYDHPMLWVLSQDGTPETRISLFDPVACAYTGESWVLEGAGSGAAFDADSYVSGIGALIIMDGGGLIKAYEICQLTGVSMSCSNLSPIICRGKNVYFQVTTANNTGSAFNVTMTFKGYAGFDCDPGNTLISIAHVKNVPSGTNTVSYFFSVPNAAAPGPYSMSVEFTYEGTTYFWCMNVTIVQCSPWKTGDNTEWAIGEVDRAEVLPTTTALAQNHPNPFNANTNIGYLLAEAGNVNLSVYDITGRLVETLIDGYQATGEHVVTWDASGVASGVYFYKLTTSDYTATKMMNLLK